jgi:hypothetical protein
MVKDIALLLGGLVVVFVGGAIAIAVLKPKPSGAPNAWVYSVLPDGFFPDGSRKYAASVAPDSGENWAWAFVGRAFKTLDEARTAAVAEITKRGGVPREFTA